MPEFFGPNAKMDFTEDKESAVPDFEMKDGIEVQRVWRTLSENKNSTGGFYVWDIMEYMSDKEPESFIVDSFIQCRDGSWIMIQCYHSWTHKQATNTLLAKGAFYQDVIVIYPKERRFECETHGMQDESTHYNSEYECGEIVKSDCPPTNCRCVNCRNARNM